MKRCTKTALSILLFIFTVILISTLSDTTLASDRNSHIRQFKIIEDEYDSGLRPVIGDPGDDPTLSFLGTGTPPATTAGSSSDTLQDTRELSETQKTLSDFRLIVEMLIGMTGLLR